MGLEKAIASGQEHRKPYHGAKAVCFNCRNHGTCDYCKSNRLHSTRRREAAADTQQREYNSYNCDGEDSAADVFYESRPAVLTKKDTGIATWPPIMAGANREINRNHKKWASFLSAVTFHERVLLVAAQKPTLVDSYREGTVAVTFYESPLQKHKPVIRAVAQITGPSAFVGCVGQARERKMLTACLRGISQVCLCQIPFQQESAEIGKCVDVIAEADIAAGELDAAVDVVILLTGNQCTNGFCSAVFRLDLNRSHKK